MTKRLGRCQDCAAWDPFQAALGLDNRRACHRFPPHIGSYSDIFPMTKAEHGCFEFIPREEKPDAHL